MQVVRFGISAMHVTAYGVRVASARRGPLPPNLLAIGSLSSKVALEEDKKRHFIQSYSRSLSCVTWMRMDQRQLYMHTDNGTGRSYSPPSPSPSAVV